MPDVVKIATKPPTRRFSNDIKEVPCTEVIDTSPPHIEKLIHAEILKEMLADPYASLSGPFKVEARRRIAEAHEEERKYEEEINAERKRN